MEQKYFKQDLNKDFEKGDVIKLNGKNKIYIINFNPENLLKYNQDYFKKRGKKAKVFLLIRNDKKTGGGFLNIFNKREDENLKLTIPYKYFHNFMEYLNIFKKSDKKENEVFVETMNTAPINIIKKDEKNELNNNEKYNLFGFKVEQKEEPKIESTVDQKVEPKVEPIVDQKVEPIVEQKEEPIVEQKGESREREIKVVIEGDILEFTREYYENKRTENKNIN